MSDPGPPPAPDWVLGSDGHWKPPPMIVGGPTPGPKGQPAAPAAWTSTAAPGPTGAPAPGAPGPGAPAAAPPWAPGGPVPPGAGTAGPSTAKTVAMVVGGVAAGGLALLVTLIFAVTFLGTTAEPQATRVDTGAEREPEAGIADVAGSPSAEWPSDLDPEVVTSAIAIRLDEHGWTPVDGRVEEWDPPACAVPGWNDGVISAFSSDYVRTDGGPARLDVFVAAYEGLDAASAELGRIEDRASLDCYAEMVTPADATGTAKASRLPDDAAAPGVGWQVEAPTPDGVAQYVAFQVVVGQLRALVQFCACGDMPLIQKRAAAQAAAEILAIAQDLPVPGR